MVQIIIMLGEGVPIIITPGLVVGVPIIIMLGVGEGVPIIIISR